MSDKFRTENKLSSVTDLEQPKGLVFHYANFDSFLNYILRNEELKAGHIRFTNDGQEYEIGKKLLKVDLGTDIPDIFATCLCENGDSRAMWSEYMRGHNGVSIGFDFFTDSHRFEQDGRSAYSVKVKLKPVDKIIDRKNDECESPLNKVLYVFNSKEHYKNKVYESVYDKSNKLLKKYISNKNRTEDNNPRLCLPYVKHPTFVEESEVRIAFQFGEYFPRAEFFHYALKENKEIDPPFVLYRIASSSKSYNNKEEVKLKYKKFLHKGKGIIELLGKEELVDTGITYRQVINQKYNAEKLYGFMCALVLEKNVTHEFYIPEYCGETEDPKNDFRDLMQKIIEELPISRIEGIKIWQLGRLPIRKIFVKRGPDTDRMVESLRSKFRAENWLKYVSVLPSSIPYVETMNTNNNDKIK